MNCFSIITIILPISITSLNKSSNRIYTLPGINHNFASPSFSGYLQVAKSRFVHYFFVQSENNSQTDPLIVWLNGGPGCSSIGSMFLDNGPWTLPFDGGPFVDNVYSWAKFANMLYIDSPTWTGFSFGISMNDVQNSDDLSAKDNLQAIKEFYQKFPKFRKNDLFVMGLSYAGVSVPLLSVLLIKEPAINYRGFAVGNGYFDQAKLGNSVIYYAHAHGLIDRPKWMLAKRVCCRHESGDSLMCNFVKESQANLVCKNVITAIVLVLSKMNGINPYNIYDNCRRKNAKTSLIGRYNLGWELIFKSLNMEKLISHLDPLEPCEDYDHLQRYMNRVDVKLALNVPTHLPKWKFCNRLVPLTYTRQHASLKDEVMLTIKAGRRGLIFNGDYDLVCDFIGNSWYVY